MDENDITINNILVSLEGIIPRESEEYIGLKESLQSLEYRWSRREEEICELKDRELESLESQLTEAHRREQFINEIGRQLTASLDLDTIISTFHRFVESRFPVDRILLAFYRRQEDLLFYRVFEEDRMSQQVPETVHLSVVHQMVTEAVREKRVLVKNDLKPDGSDFITSRGGSLILLPLRIEGRIIGVTVLHSDQPGAYRDEQRDILLSLTPFLSIAVSNAQSHEEIASLNLELENEKRELTAAYTRITKMANYDSLTDLPNLRLLNEFFPRYMEHARRQEWILAVFFIDLDDFKPVNDTYGHETGDSILVRASQRIKRSLRRSDVVARVGGDEFIALVQGFSGEAGVIIAAEKILSEFDEPFDINEKKCRLGVSIGISLYPGDGETPEELKNNADRAMYRIKGGNKDGYAFYRDLQPGYYK